MTIRLHLSLGAAALATVLSAQGAILDARFSGTVSSQTATSFAVGASVSGEFVFDTVTGNFLSFEVAGVSAAPGFASTAAFSPDNSTALYRAQVSPVDQGGSVNRTLVVDLEALNLPWQSASAATLLSDTPQLASDLDRSSSFFGFYSAAASGANVQSLNASLDRLQVIAPVPEPASAVLLLLGGGALLLGRTGRRHLKRPER